MLYGILTFFYIVVCVFLILVVLLQTGKRADLAGAFGGGGSQTAFGARGAATLLTKLTTVAAVLFMIGALTLAILSSRSSSQRGSVLDQFQDPVPAAPAPADPGMPAPSGDGSSSSPLPEVPAEDEPAAPDGNPGNATEP